MEPSVIGNIGLTCWYLNVNSQNLCKDDSRTSIPHFYIRRSKSWCFWALGGWTKNLEWKHETEKLLWGDAPALQKKHVAWNKNILQKRQKLWSEKFLNKKNSLEESPPTVFFLAEQTPPKKVYILAGPKKFSCNYFFACKETWFLAIFPKPLQRLAKWKKNQGAEGGNGAIIPAKWKNISKREIFQKFSKNHEIIEIFMKQPI